MLRRGGKMARQPTLRHAVFRAVAKRNHRLAQIQPMRCQHRRLACRIKGKARLRRYAVKCRLRFVRQRGVPVHHQRQRRLIQLADVVQQQITLLAHIARALLDARGKRQKTHFQAACSGDDLVVTALAQHPPHAPTLAQLQRAVPERVVQNLVHLVHAPIHRLRPLGCKHINHAIGMQFAQAAQHRLRHHAIANPRRRQNQYFFSHFILFAKPKTHRL